MEDEQRASIHGDPIIFQGKLVAAKVPRREVYAGMADDFHAGKPFRPVVQVFLVGKPAILKTVVAPFEASVAPPLETRACVGISAERQPANIENPPLLQRF